jgi:hypothetical protein
VGVVQAESQNQSDSGHDQSVSFHINSTIGLLEPHCAPTLIQPVFPVKPENLEFYPSGANQFLAVP